MLEKTTRFRELLQLSVFEKARAFSRQNERQGYDGDRTIFFSKISAHAEPFGLGRKQLYLDNAELANLGDSRTLVGNKLPNVIMHEIENIAVACTRD